MEFITELFALIKEALPELAKEAGWIDPAEVITVAEFDTRRGRDLLKKWAKDNGYVKLADDQSLPPLGIIDAVYVVQALLDAGWRKVILAQPE